MTGRMNIKLARIGAYIDLVTGMLSRASNQLVGLLITVVAIPLLSPNEFGVFAIASSFVAIARILLYSATFQYLIETKDLRETSTECIVVSAGVSFLATLIPLCLLLFFDPFKSPQLLHFFILLAPSNILSVFCAWQEAQLLRHGKLRGYYGVTAGTEFLSAFIAIGMLFAGFGLAALAWQIYLRSILQIFGYRYLSRPVLSRAFSLGRVFEIAKWSLPQYGSMITGLISMYGADFIVGVILSPAATGVFRAANRITTAVGDVCGQPIRIIALTLFARRSSAGLQSDNALARMLGLTVLLPGSVLLGLAIIAPVAIPLLLKPEWAGVEIVVVYLCLGRFFSIVQSVSSPLLIAYNRQSILLPTQTVFSAILIVGLLIAAHYGVEAASLAFTASATVGGSVYAYLAAATAQTTIQAAMRNLVPTLACAILPNLLAFVILHVMSSWTDAIVALCVSIAAAALAFAMLIIVLRKQVTAIVESINKVDTD